jgi:hypothetical protein
MIANKRSTLMADVYAIHRSIAKRSIVKVSGVGIQRPTLVGNAVKHFNANSHIVSVGAEEVKNNPSDPVEHHSESRQIANKVTDSLGETAGKFVLGSMVIGPPVIGSLLWGGTGFIVGTMIASPFVLAFVWSILK